MKALRLVLLAAVAQVSCAPPRSVPPEDPGIAALEALVPTRMAHHRIPGASVAVVRDGRVAWARAWGTRSADATQAKVLPSTLFQAASMSKPVSVLGAMLLVQRGALDLDGDVNARLRTWKVPVDDLTREHPVTLRLLASHTAGFDVPGFWGYPRGAALPTVPELLDARPPATNAKVRVTAVPGARFAYSGGGTEVLEQLVTDASGQPFPAFMTASLFAPLGMTRSTFAQPLGADLEGDASRAHDHRGRVVPGGVHVYPEHAAAGLWSTPTDLARVLVEVQRGRFGAEVLTRQAASPFALGFEIEGEGAARRFEHLGRNRGFAGHMRASVEGGYGVVVMTNGELGEPLIAEIEEALAHAYGWPWPDAPRVTVAAAPIARFAGRYMFEGRPVTIAVEGGRVFWQEEDARTPNAQELLPTSTSEAAAPSGKFAVRFDLPADGPAIGFVFHAGTSDLRAERAAP